MLPIQLHLKAFRTLFRNFKLVCVALCVAFLFIICSTHLFLSPKADRDWTLDQKILPSIIFDGDIVTIRNIRNFLYTSETEYKPNYYNASFNLNEIVSVDFIVEPLKPVAIAHTFVSFGFRDGSYLAISVEIRKEKGETFSPTKGLLNQFELAYVIADEKDVIRLRAIHRKDLVRLYHVHATPEEMQSFFIAMLNRAQALEKYPEFYNTLTNTCTTNIRDHINEITNHAVPWDLRILFPLQSDEYAYELGLLDTSMPFSELREASTINDAVIQYADDPDFSRKIREQLKPLPLD